MKTNATTERAPYGSGSLYKGKNWKGETGYWYQTSHQSPEGKRYYIRGFGHTQAQAYAKYRDNVEKRNQKALAQLEAPSTEQKTYTVAEYCEIWRNNIQPTVGAQTFRKYSKDLENHILPHVGKKRIDLLVKQDFHNLFYKSLDNIGTSARFHAYKTFNIVLNAAFDDGIVERNFLKTIVTPKHESKVQELDNEFIDRRVGIATNMLKWLANPENPYHEHHNRILFMFLGLRRGELLGMEWSSITGLDRKNGAKLKVNRILNRHEKHTGNSGYYIQPYTKTKNSRKIFLPEPWRIALLEEKKKNRVANDPQFSNLVFLTPQGDQYAWGKHDRLWREILTAYINSGRKQKFEKLPDEWYFRPHAMRHITASVLFSQGVSIQHAAEILGHDSARMTEHYTHFMKKNQMESSAALSSGFKFE